MAWINEKNLYVDMYNSPEPLLLLIRVQYTCLLKHSLPKY